jgi:hypothetical protein
MENLGHVSVIEDFVNADSATSEVPTHIEVIVAVLQKSTATKRVKQQSAVYSQEQDVVPT